TLKTLKSFCLNVYLVIVVLLITVILYTYFIIILFEYIKNNANIKNKLGGIVMEIYKFAYQIIKEAGRHIRETIDEELEIETKSNPNDLVTNMDKETEERLFNNIKATYPEHFILGEEGHGKDIENTKGVLRSEEHTSELQSRFELVCRLLLE